MQDHRNKLLAGVAAAAFLGPFSQTVYAPSLVQLQGYFHVNTLLINLTISLFTAILAFSNFAVGPLADRYGRRATLLPGLAVFALGSLLCMVSTNYWVFLGGRVVQAAGISTAVLIAPTVIGDLYAPEERGQAMGSYQVVTYLGPVLGPVLGGLMAGYLSWQWIFALLAAAAVAVWAYNRRVLVETLPRDYVRPPVSVRAFAAILRNRSAFAIIVVGFSQLFGYYSFLVFLPSLLHALLAVPGALHGLLFVPLTAALLAGIKVGGHWQKQWPRTRIMNATSWAMGACVLVLWVLLQSGLVGALTLVACLLAYGLFLGCSLPVQSTILVNLFTHDKATAVGLYNVARFVGAALGPLVGGVLVMHFSVNAVFLSTALLLGGAALVISRNLADPFEAGKAVR